MSLPDPPLDPQDHAPAGPMLALVARGLELWLRQRCEAVEGLELSLEGSLAQLLRGHLQGARLHARQVEFQELSLESVDLCSEPIRLKIRGLLRGQALQLEQPFRVRGSVRFSGEGLSRSLRMAQWQDLAEHLSRQVLGGSPLQSLRLEEERLILQGSRGEEILEVATRPVLTPQGLQLCPLDGGEAIPVPMDAAIRLDRAELRAGVLEFAGEALVQPD